MMVDRIDSAQLAAMAYHFGSAHAKALVHAVCHVPLRSSFSGVRVPAIHFYRVVFTQTVRTGCNLLKFENRGVQAEEPSSDRYRRHF